MGAWPPSAFPSVQLAVPHSGVVSSPGLLGLVTWNLHSSTCSSSRTLSAVRLAAHTGF